MNHYRGFGKDAAAYKKETTASSRRRETHKKVRK